MLFQYLKRAFLTRKSWVAVLSLTQIALTVALGIWLQQYAVYTYMAITAVSLIAVAILLDKDDVNPVYKLMWLLIILLLPPTGTIFYLYWGGRSRHGRKARQYSACSGPGPTRLCPIPSPLWPCCRAMMCPLPAAAGILPSTPMRRCGTIPPAGTMPGARNSCPTIWKSFKKPSNSSSWNISSFRKASSGIRCWKF